MTIFTVNNSSELTSALGSAAGGDTINCVSGSIYTLNGYSGTFASPVYVRSVPDASRAEFTLFKLNGATNLWLQDILFSYQHATGQGERADNFQAQACTDITFERCEFQGSYAVEGTGPELWLDEPAGKGFEMESNTRGRFIDCEFHRWWTALFVNSESGGIATDCEVVGCEFYDNAVDNIALGRSESTVVEWCYFHDMFDTSGTGHPDMIQIRGAGGPVLNPTIRYNIFDKGTGVWTQTIFSGLDARGDTGNHHVNVTITDNTIYNSQTHGITMDRVNGGLIARNTMIQVPKDADQTGTSFVPTIQLTDDTYGMTIEDNITPNISGVSVGANTLTSNSIVVEADYGTEFNQLKTAASDGYNQFTFKSGGTLISADDGAQAVNDAYTFDNLTWIRSRGGAVDPGPAVKGAISGSKFIVENGKLVVG